MKLGVFGGTFDPPHVGHLLGATDALEQLGLDHLIIVPAAQQPFKTATDSAPAEQRLAMVQLAFGDDPRFIVDPVEIRRGGLSFTVDTLAELRRRHGDARMTLLLGSDVLASFGKWRDPEGILELATLAVLVRWDGVGSDRVDPGVEALRDFRNRFAAAIQGSPDAVRTLDTRRIDVSSTEIRSRVRGGRTLRGFVSDAVARYIDTNGLYR